MRILVSAFSFAPHQGSEPGVGWRWALELAREHQVVVLTDATRRPLVDPELALHPQANLRVVYHRPGWLARVPLNSTTAQTLYALWQYSLPGLARRLHAEQPFQLALHLTYGVFRHPSFLGGLGIPFIFGPVGGGEDAPRALKRSITGRERVKEALRTAANRVALFDPLLWWGLSRADLILVKTPESRAALPWPFRERALVYPEIGIDAVQQQEPARREPGQPLRALYAGRLLGWKGVHLAIRAVAEARSRGCPVELDIVGRGPFEAALRALTAKLGMSSAVRFMGHVPQQRLFELYRCAHVFLFPSLHDSSGNVVLEAQAYGCPVICLGLGGPATLVSEASAWIVSTRNCNESDVVDGLAGALEQCASDEQQRLRRGEAARELAQASNWARRVEGCLALARNAQLISYAKPAQGWT